MEGFNVEQTHGVLYARDARAGHGRHGNAPNRLTIEPISHSRTPVTLPGITLPAGRYLFRLADPNSSRKVISVLSEDGKTPLAMLHTIPNQLPKAPNDPEVRFLETSGNMPPPIKGWWYPGKSIGYEFIYPRAQALQLAKVTSEPVLTTSAETKNVATATCLESTVRAFQPP
jgi:hypothetical protein